MTRNPISNTTTSELKSLKEVVRSNQAVLKRTELDSQINRWGMKRATSSGLSIKRATSPKARTWWRSVSYLFLYTTSGLDYNGEFKANKQNKKTYIARKMDSATKNPKLNGTIP